MDAITQIIIKTRAQSRSPIVAEVCAILGENAGMGQYRGAQDEPTHYAIFVTGDLPAPAAAQLRALAASKPRNVRLA